MAALLSALVTGALLLIGRVIVDRKLGDQEFSTEFRGDLMAEVKALREEVKAIKKESDEWRAKYWVLSEQMSELRSHIAKDEGGTE